MVKLLLPLIVLALCHCAAMAGKTVVTATLKGYSGKMVYFDFMPQTEENREYPYEEGRTYTFEADLKDITLMKINSWVWICLKPGDNLSVSLTYNERNYRTAEFSGTADAVAVNEALRDMRMLRVGNRYKTDTDAAAVTLVPADTYQNMCLEQWKKETEILDRAKGRMSGKMYNFLLSEHEAMFLGNLIAFPYLRASYDRKQIGDVLPEDYWEVLDHYTPRGDKGSLYSQAYEGFLVPYADYVRRRELARVGKEWTADLTLEEGFDYLASFYQKDMRDAALCVYLYNAAASGKDFGRIDKLTKIYLKKYNKNKKYRDVLTEVMQ